MDIKCPHCNSIVLETTETYTTDKNSNGTMFKRKEEYGINGLNWSCFPLIEETIYDALECPSCGISMVDGEGVVHAEQEVNDSNSVPLETVLLKNVEIILKELSQVKTETVIQPNVEILKCDVVGCDATFINKRALHMHGVGKHGKGKTGEIKV